MKKLVIVFLTMLAAVACQREEFAAQSPVDSTPMHFDLNVNAMGGEATKATLKADWTAGDAVYVFFDAIPAKYVKKSFDGTSWDETYPGGDFVSGDFSADGPAASRKMTAVWFPQREVTVTYADSKFSFTLDGEKIYSHYMSVHADYALSGSTVTGSLDMEKPAGFVQFFVPGIAAADAPAYRLMEYHLTPKACDYVPLAGGVAESALSAGYSLKAMAFTADDSRTGSLFGGYLSSAGEDTEYRFSLVKTYSADKPASVGTYTLSGIRTIREGSSMTFPALTGWGEMNPFVDLGYGGPLWATGNLDRTHACIVSPLQSGEYFQWGATRPEESCYTGNESVLPTDNDAAYKVNNDWRIPTSAEYSDLLTHTDAKWENGSGGYLTSKENGITVFFPAAGFWNSIYNRMENEGTEGDYWTSSQTDGYVDSFYMSSSFCDVSSSFMSSFGLPIRPVMHVAPVQLTHTFNLAKITADTPESERTAQDGWMMVGTLGVSQQILIADGATVKLRNINAIAGITCLGDATLILMDGTTNSVTVAEGFNAGISVPSGKTLVIQCETAGTGSLTVSSASSTGIGSGDSKQGGNIVMEGGIVTATGGGKSPGIGAGWGGSCGAITISGGEVTAIGAPFSAAIGGGASASCGDILIKSTVKHVTATKGVDYEYASISAGSTCGTITIEDPSKVTQN